MDDRRVAVAVLALVGQLDRLVDVRHADERDERHHLLVLDERVVERRSRRRGSASPAGRSTPAALRQHGGVLADQVLVHVELAVLRSGCEGAPRQRLDLRGVQHEAAVRAPSASSACRRRSSTAKTCFSPMHSRLLSYAAALDDRRRPRSSRSGRLIDDDRRIARPGDDRPLLRRQRRPGDGRAAGDDSSGRRVVEDRLGRFSVGGSMIVIRLSMPNRCAIAWLNARTPCGGDCAPPRVRVEDDRVARGEHVDRVARQRRQRCVTGVMTPMTPNGAYSSRQSRRPLLALVLRNSTPGTSSRICELLDLVLEPADLRLLELHPAPSVGVAASRST